MQACSSMCQKRRDVGAASLASLRLRSLQGQFTTVCGIAEFVHDGTPLVKEHHSFGVAGACSDCTFCIACVRDLAR
eukprot:3590642-Amphidinium_carterae.1